MLFEGIHVFAGVSPVVDMVSVFMARYFPVVIAVFVLFFIFRRNSLKEKLFVLCFIFLSALISRGILAAVVKFFYYHPRPFETFNFTPLVYSFGNSFPSGHASILFALAFAVWFFNKKWGIWLSAGALLNGVGRIFVGVHFPADIIGGMFVALAAVFIARLLIYRFYLFPRSTESSPQKSV
ncbi:hypothetical protein A3I34_02925 [Candidatus Jorgensenbacteria bacterium RIFCSPLOWO2_02_FULL_45_12]|uniref:Phosphatidic acid phosphatase type 2/haloperoxidase domain-containing protein n=2 Tax=Candidatus Joergenseniibacteriota TaxID=1752739 RepID=A0A1F6BNC4_9BACT|nr:MAG: hypothetical protein UX22_C0008G0008 [Candidatus Jorgensenbacteria bacterium GW2011_GWA2_45_9]OGG38272.1 MAG: hypothetical protein A3D55_01415 [Candidatus Jorgensenbacteria bacterium RIFCSPHIGHO2_02_FULL_45_20]OGG42302.1 MAG: hypothetical protein A3I34_02925 [Candidatus Jorgensenbacteria bacterium RIFCSPLOWO2_02_FULL_45_12]